jgi:hypothetical protein
MGHGGLGWRMSHSCISRISEISFLSQLNDRSHLANAVEWETIELDV